MVVDREKKRSLSHGDISKQSKAVESKVFLWWICWFLCNGVGGQTLKRHNLTNDQIANLKNFGGENLDEQSISLLRYIAINIRASLMVTML